ncbi:MAG: hypothetical protein JXB17_08100 [Bacteroidales bacterium]|nr:hypothetical protein [Bacteroidales bacterium]
MQLEIPGREASIYTYQWFKCENCGKTYYGSLEEFLDVFDNDLMHIGYLAEPEKWEKSLKIIKSCPNLEYKSCKCKIHQKYANEGFDGVLKIVPMNLRNY